MSEEMAGVRLLTPLLGVFLTLNSWGSEALNVTPLVEAEGMVPGLEIPFVVGLGRREGLFHIESIKVKSDQCQARRDRFRVNLFLVKCATVERLRFELRGKLGDRVLKFDVGPYTMQAGEKGYTVLQDLRLSVDGVQ